MNFIAAIVYYLRAEMELFCWPCIEVVCSGLLELLWVIRVTNELRSNTVSLFVMDQRDFSLPLRFFASPAAAPRLRIIIELWLVHYIVSVCHGQTGFFAHLIPSIDSYSTSRLGIPLTTASQYVSVCMNHLDLWRFAFSLRFSFFVCYFMMWFLLHYLFFFSFFSITRYWIFDICKLD